MVNLRIQMHIVCIFRISKKTIRFLCTRGHEFLQVWLYPWQRLSALELLHQFIEKGTVKPTIYKVLPIECAE